VVEKGFLHRRENVGPLELLEEGKRKTSEKAFVKFSENKQHFSIVELL